MEETPWDEIQMCSLSVYMFLSLYNSLSEFTLSQSLSAVAKSVVRFIRESPRINTTSSLLTRENIENESLASEILANLT